jgi:trehalose/maltose hydrolase-like predicted phosphorylase
VRREIAGDLDNIILKALHKEPARRYESMAQLSDDLGRFLSELPVSARTATVGYRARKFVRRHKAVVLAATLVASALLAATVISVRQARRADAQAERAEIERQKAVDAAAREHAETERARQAEARSQAQLDQLRAEQMARANAEAEARAKRSEAELSREQLQDALARARQEKLIAEQESRRAHDAEARAAAAALAEKATREEAEALYRKEKARVEQLELESKKITNQLR